MVTASGPATWADLDRELDAWRVLGRAAPLWWRDDDAIAATPALARLQTVSGEGGVPVCLAVIPAAMTDDLAPALAAHVTVVPHGFAHRNHAGPGARKAEFGADRPLSVMAAEVAAGWQRIRDRFAARARPVFVPPWNRVTEALLPHLRQAGLTGLSAKGPRAIPSVTGITVRDVAVDIIDWRGGRGFLGTGAVLGQIVEGLQARRLGEGDADHGPLGILTHHLVHDDAAWDFLVALCRHLDRSGAVRWQDVDAVFTRAG